MIRQKPTPLRRAKRASSTSLELRSCMQLRKIEIHQPDLKYKTALDIQLLNAQTSVRFSKSFFAAQRNTTPDRLLPRRAARRKG